MTQFGICDIDKQYCYPKGCICRLNKKAGFQKQFEGTSSGLEQPFRNKKCCHYKKDEKTNSEYESGLGALEHYFKVRGF